jgi:hypothetical protein
MYMSEIIEKMNDLTSLLQKLEKTPYRDKLWNMQAMLNGKKVIGYKLTDEERELYERAFICGRLQWIYQDGVAWRYEAE